MRTVRKKKHSYSEVVFFQETNNKKGDFYCYTVGKPYRSEGFVHAIVYDGQACSVFYNDLKENPCITHYWNVKGLVGKALLEKEVPNEA